MDYLDELMKLETLAAAAGVDAEEMMGAYELRRYALEEETQADEED